jgi:carboxyl-terminal processing protease
MLRRMTRVFLGVSALLVVSAIGIGAFFVGRESAPEKHTASASASDTNFDYGLLNQVRQLLDKNFVKQDDLDSELMFDAAINGMLGSLNDKGTYYVTPEEYKLDTPVSGFFDGIGATVTQQGDEVAISAALKGTPAEKAGLRSGDVIVAVDGENAKGWTTQKAVSKIRGQRGTVVTLSIRHSDGTTEDFKITRAPVPVDSVNTTPPGGSLKDASGNVVNIGYIQIREFSGRTPQEMDAAIKDVIAKGAKGIILDVRFNPGGLLNSVTTIADLFLDSGTIVTEKEASGRETTIAARSGQAAANIPIVLVQNKYSASASEVLAAALHDNGRATILGEKSYGKGTVNTAKQLPNGGVLYVSIAYWVTPKGVVIDNVGITPDVEVALTDADIDAKRDTQLAKAVEVLRGQIN